MSRNKIEFTLGIIVILLTVPGIPTGIKDIFLMLIGATFIVVAVLSHFKRRSEIISTKFHIDHSDNPVFVENK